MQEVSNSQKVRLAFGSTACRYYWFVEVQNLQSFLLYRDPQATRSARRCTPDSLWTAPGSILLDFWALWNDVDFCIF